MLAFFCRICQRSQPFPIAESIRAELSPGLIKAKSVSVQGHRESAAHKYVRAALSGGQFTGGGGGVFGGGGGDR